MQEFPGTTSGPWSRYVHDPYARGLGTVRYPRLVPKDADCAQKLPKRTLTNLYNEWPMWLDLAVIRNEAEVALRAPRSVENYCQVLEDLLEETDRLSHIAEQLLFLSRQDAGLHPSANEELAAEELLNQVVGNMQLVAQEKGVRLILAGNASCRLLSDPRQLRRVLYNLLDNAIKYLARPSRNQKKTTTDFTDNTDGKFRGCFYPCYPCYPWLEFAQNKFARLA